MNVAKRALVPLKVAFGVYGMWGVLGAYRGIQWYNYNYDCRRKYLRLPVEPKYDFKECAKCSLNELVLYMNPSTFAYTVRRELKGGIK